MNPKELKEEFDALHIAGWEFVRPLPKSGQASLAIIRKISEDPIEGVFRKLHRNDKVASERFKREVRLISSGKYKSDHIMEILVSDVTNHWYISKKGESFSGYWAQSIGGMSTSARVDAAFQVIKEICVGLSELHQDQIVHRDIKPDNLIVIDGKVILIDFGVVYEPDDERITDINGAVGNQRYSADQMMAYMDEVEPWLDVFQMSQLLIWLICEEPTKNLKWRRPLDWRWVKYPKDISSKDALSLRALTAICSNYFTSPKDADELLNLIWELT